MKKFLNGFLNSVAKKAVQRCAVVAVMGSATLFTAAISHAAETTIPVDIAGAKTTKHEIAVLQVLSEVCPPMLNTQQRSNFYKTYNSQLKEMLPTIDDPRAAIQYLSTQQDYRSILTSMRNWTMGFSRDENLALCHDLANADNK